MMGSFWKLGRKLRGRESHDRTREGSGVEPGAEALSPDSQATTSPLARHCLCILSHLFSKQLTGSYHVPRATLGSQSCTELGS